MLVGSRLPLGPIREYTGNVRIKQGDIRIKTNKAMQFFFNNTSELEGNVIFNQKDLELKSPKVTYNADTKIAKAFYSLEIIDGKNKITSKSGEYNGFTYNAYFYDNVVMENDTAIIYSDRAIYNRQTKVAWLYGNVYLKGKKVNSSITCDSLFNNPNEGFTNAMGNPILEQVDTIKNKDNLGTLDTMIVSSMDMKAYRGAKETYKFKDSVEIYKNDSQIKCGYALFEKHIGRIKLNYNPIIWLDNTILYSDTITVMTSQNKLRTVYMESNAITGTLEDSTYKDRVNQIIGDEILIEFQEGKIKVLESYQNAKSLYYLMNDSIPDGASVTACDTIVANFNNGQADEIVWLGKVAGDVFPESNVEQNPKEYYLPKFVWFGNKPKKKKLQGKFVKQ